MSYYQYFKQVSTDGRVQCRMCGMEFSDWQNAYAQHRCPSPCATVETNLRRDLIETCRPLTIGEERAVSHDLDADADTRQRAGCLGAMRCVCPVCWAARKTMKELTGGTE